MSAEDRPPADPDAGADLRQTPAVPAVPDQLHELRMLKWWTRLIVYPGITMLIAFDHILSGLTWQPAIYVLLGGFAIATLAIELVFARVFRLRKRGAYPGLMSIQLGAMPSFDVACQAAVGLVDKLLHTRGSFLTLRNDSGFLSLAALTNLSRVGADRYLRLGATRVQRAISRDEVVALRPHSDPLAEAIMPPDQQIVFVPVRSYQGVMGVLGLVADRSNAELRDSELLAALGRAMGVSLESLREHDELRRLVAIDDLTRVYNRRHFFDHLARELATASRYSIPVAVLILDLDGLKKLNDGYGHSIGDEALRTVAQRLVRYSRASDIVARLGGDEFAVILPRTDKAAAAEIARRLRDSVEKEPLVAVPGHDLRIAISCGSASYPEDATDAGQLVRTADGHLYAAKAARVRGTRERRE